MSALEYHTQLSRLIIPEYGRNVQRMIDHAVTIENREERNKCAKAIVEVMGQLNAQLKDITDFKHKLWDHLFVISDFKLDVDSPYPIPSRETFKTKPEKVPYPGEAIRFRHYGKIAERLVAKAVEMEEGEKRDHLVESIANMMKRFYAIWNRDVVGDELIWDQLEKLSAGKVKMPENVKLQVVNDPPARTGYGQGGQNPRRKKGRNHNNRKRY